MKEKAIKYGVQLLVVTAGVILGTVIIQQYNKSRIASPKTTTT